MAIDLWRTRPNLHTNTPLRQWVDRVFDDAFARDGAPVQNGSAGFQSLPVNVWETSEGYQAALLAPGLDEQSISVTVHVVLAPDVTLEGAHASDETLGAGVTVTVAVVLPPSVAVTVTVWDVATEPAVAVNMVELVAAGTVTVAGTGSVVVLLEASITELPPAGAA